MKNSKTIPIKLIVILAALAVLASACNLTDLLTGQCSAPAVNVTKTEDTNDGLCSANDCSLREALVTANSCSGTQTIQIPSGTYSLTKTGVDEEAAETGDLDITDSLIIQGQGNSIIDGNAADRIFEIKPGITVSISGLVLQNGQTPLFGSAIANQGVLTVDHVVLQNNHQTDTTGNGGAIFTYDVGSSLNISNSAVVNNWAAVDAAGLYNVAGTMMLENVTITGNHGYGVANVQGGLTQIKFSTIANDFGTYEIWNPGIGSAVEVSNSIIAGRTTEGNCFQPVTSNGFTIDSAVGGTANTCGLSLPTDLINTDPLLLPLTANGGDTLTLALDSASPAINSADPASCSGTDQRGITRPQGAKCDRGAFELQNPPARPTLTPTPRPSATPTPKPTSSHSGLTLTFNTNANCRKGPGTGYIFVAPFKQGATVDITGRNDQKTWALVKIPASDKSCWVAVSLGNLSGSLSDVPVYPTPPIPSAPSSFQDSSKCEGDQRIVKLTWTGILNATGINIYRNGKPLTTTGASSGYYEDNVPRGRDFLYEIEAFNDYGVSARIATTSLACQ